MKPGTQPLVRLTPGPGLITMVQCPNALRDRINTTNWSWYSHLSSSQPQVVSQSNTLNRPNFMQFSTQLLAGIFIFCKFGREKKKASNGKSFKSTALIGRDSSRRSVVKTDKGIPKVLFGYNFQVELLGVFKTLDFVIIGAKRHVVPRNSELKRRYW